MDGNKLFGTESSKREEKVMHVQVVLNRDLFEVSWDFKKHPLI